MQTSNRQQTSLSTSHVAPAGVLPREGQRLAIGASLAAALVVSTGCSSISDSLGGQKVDYRTSGAQTVRLDVPPDLSQLPGQQRYGQVPAASVSATNLARQNPGEQSTASATVSPAEVGSVKLERNGASRWLVVSESPEQVWDKLRDFWKETGFDLAKDDPQAGVMETAWSENRAKVPQDGIIRQSLGRVFDLLYDTGERDMYRTRVERTASGSEIYISHRGLSEEYEDSKKERTTWRGRPSDPGLEAEMLRKLMLKLGSTPAAANAAAIDTAAAATPAGPANNSIARLNADGVSLMVDGDVELAWRRVGLALDRSGFTVESRDRKQGLYEVRLSDSDVEANKPGFFARLFGSSNANTDGLRRYRVTVQGQGRTSLVSVQDDSGKPAQGDVPRKIAKQIAEQLG
ncbi:MAG: outer membrane protein assembly factor BamC [Aquabacterium sp.]